MGTCALCRQVLHGARSHGGVQTKYSALHIWLAIVMCITSAVEVAIGAAIQEGKATCVRMPIVIDRLFRLCSLQVSTGPCRPPSTNPIVAQFHLGVACVSAPLANLRTSFITLGCTMALHLGKSKGFISDPAGALN